MTESTGQETQHHTAALLEYIHTFVHMYVCKYVRMYIYKKAGVLLLRCLMHVCKQHVIVLH